MLTPTDADPTSRGHQEWRLTPWAGVVADIAAQHRRRTDTHTDGGVRDDLNAHPGDRFPRAALRRHIQIRDRTCIFIGCRAPAWRADQDHTLDHTHGGTTTTDDLSPLCRHDHTLKTDGGWALRQPEPGRFVWRSPLGRNYPVAPEPILPQAPEVVPREPDPDHDKPARDTDRPLQLRRRGRAPPPDDRQAPAANPPTEAKPPNAVDDPPPF